MLGEQLRGDVLDALPVVAAFADRQKREMREIMRP